MIDLHCHILPGLDDGPRGVDEAMAMVRMAAEDGTRTICATPHKGTSEWNASRETIIEFTRRMRSLIAQAGVAIDLLPGCELSATSDIDALGRAGDLVPLGGKGRFLLVELPFTGHVGAMQNLFFELEVMGYRIIIAHPERSMACQREPDLIERLHDRGYWTQINAGSFAGRNGRRVRNLCLQWLRKGLVDVIASDGHSVRSRRPLLSPARKTVIKATDENTWDELTVHNPAQVLASESKGTD